MFGIGTLGSLGCGTWGGGKLPFSPSTLFANNDVGVWYDIADRSTLFQDSAGTIPVTADGDKVGRINDKSGNGFHLLQSSGVLRPTYKTSNGIAWVESDGAFPYMAAAFTIAQPWDRVTGIRQISWTGSDRIMGPAVGTSAGFLYQTAITPNVALNDGTSACLNGNAPIGSDVIAIERHSGPESRLGIDSTVYSTGDVGTNLPGGLNLFSQQGGTAVGNARFYGGIMRQGTLTARQVQGMKEWVASRQGRPAPTNSMWESGPLVFCDGNSLTAGTGASNPATTAYPAQMRSLLPGWDVRNIGVGGASTTARATADPLALDQYFGMNRVSNVAVLWEITNDLKYGAPTDPVPAYNRYVSWCHGRRAAAFKVVAVTVLPRTEAGLYADFETHRLAINDMIRSNWTTFADSLADVAADPRIGSTGASDDTTYYVDKVHLNDTGYAIVANIVGPQAARLTS